jgi:hypothetical protein
MTASSLLLLDLALAIIVVATVAHPADLVGEALTRHPEGPTRAAGRAFLIAFDMAATACPTGAQGVGSAGAGHSDSVGSEKQDSPRRWTEALLRGEERDSQSETGGSQRGRHRNHFPVRMPLLSSPN